MSQQGSEGEGSVNPRRSLRHKMPRIGWGMDKGTGETKKVSYSSQRSINKRVNSNSLYGCSRSSVAGIRKLQRKGQQVKGSELLAKMTERRKKLTKGVRKTSIRQKGKEIDTNGGSKSDNGFSIPLSILNNIPDIGLCPLEEEANKRQKRRSNSSFESISSTKNAKLSGTCSDSSAGSNDSTRHLLTKRNSDNVVDRLSPKIQNATTTSSRIQNGINRNHSSKPVDHLQVLESWYHDCSHDSTKPPILWALDNMANKLIEDIEWMKRAEAIWSKWIKVPTSTRTLYISKAKDNEKNRLYKQREATMTNGHMFNGSLNDSDNSIARDPFTNRSTHISTIPSNTVAAQTVVTTPHVQQNLTPAGETSVPVPSMVTSWLGNNHNSSPVPFQMAANSFTNIIPLCFPPSFPSSLMLTANDSLKSPTISSTPSFPKDQPFLLPSTPVLKLMASPPTSMGAESSDVTKSTMASSLSNSGIPILKIENPHHPPSTNHNLPKSPAHYSNNISPAISNSQSSFCISNILANTSVLSSAPSTNIISSNRITGNKKKKNRVSPYRISNNTPLMTTVDSSLKRGSTATNIATSSCNKAGRSSKKASSNLSDKNIMNTANTVVNTSKALGEQTIVNSMTATAHLPISQPMVTATLTRPSSLQLIDNTTSADNCPIGKSIGSVITTNASRLINNSQSSPTIPQMIDNSINNEGVPLSLTVVTDEWKRSLEKQLRANKYIPRKGNNRLKSISNSHEIKNTDDKSKRKRSNVLSRPPMKLTTPSVLNQTIFERTISSSVEPSLVSPALPLSLSMAAKPFPSSSPLASPSFNIPQSPTLSNNFGSSYSQLSYRYPAMVRSTSPALFVPRAVSATPSPVSTPSVISSEMLKTSNPDIRIKATAGGLLSTPELLSPDDQAKVDARNYADLERHYWSLLLAFEEQKKTISSLKERMVKARVEQQILFLGDERFNHLKEMIVSPIWEPVEPDLLDSLNESQISTEVRIKGSFDKPILENEDVYKYLLHSVSL